MTETSRWETLTIRRFRGLRTLDLPDLGAFNVIVGANDVGKTSLLEAIFLLSGSANIGLPILVQNFRDYRVADIRGLFSLFHGLDVAKAIELSADTCNPRTRRQLLISAPPKDATVDLDPARVRSPTSSPSSSSALSTGRVVRYDLTIENHDDATSSSSSGTLSHEGDKFIPQMTADAVPDGIVLARFLHNKSSYDAKSISDIIVHKRQETLLRYLQMVNPRIKGVTADGQLAYLDIGLDKMLPLNMFGSGMGRACAVVSRCIFGDDRFLLMDEIENGLHYGAITSLLAALLTLTHDRGMQVYITTHSLGILRGLQEVLAREDMAEHRKTTVCYALQRDQDDAVRGYRYAYPDFDHCLRSGIEIR